MPQIASSRKAKTLTAPAPPIEVTTETKKVIRPASPEAIEQASAPAEREEQTAIEKLKARLAGFGPWEKLQEMTAEDWKHSIGWLYRHRGQQTEDGEGPPRASTWLDKFGQAITLDYVKSNHGGGYYWWIVHYDNEALCSKNFRIEGPPKGEGALVPQTDEKYKDFLIELVQKQMADVKANLVPPQEAVSKVFEIFGEANKATVEMLKSQIPRQADPMQQLQTMLAVLKEARELHAPAPVAPAPNPGITAESELERTATLFDRLGLLRKPNDDGLSGLGKVIGTLKEWGVIPSAAGAAGGKDDWKVALAEHAPAILGHVEGIVSRITTAIVQGRPTNPVNVARQAVGNVQPGRTMVAARQTAGASANVGAPPAQPAAGTGAPQLTEEELIAMAQANVDAFVWIRFSQLLKGGASGDEVADMLETLAPELATALRSQTAEQLETMITTHPIPDVAGLAGHPRLKPFIAEFLSYWVAEPESKPSQDEAKA